MTWQPKTVAERMSEADELMRSGLGLTVIVDQGSDTLQVHDFLGMPPAGQPEGATILDPAVTHTNLDVNIVACDSPAAELADGAVMNVAEPRSWRAYAGGAAKNGIPGLITSRWHTGKGEHHEERPSDPPARG